MPHCCDHHISNVRHLASLAPLHCLGKPARGRHHSSGSRPTGDSAGSPLRSGVSWLGMALVAACFLAEDGAIEAHAHGEWAPSAFKAVPARLSGSSSMSVVGVERFELPSACSQSRPSDRWLTLRKCFAARPSVLGGLAGLSRAGKDLVSSPRRLALT